MKVWFQVLLLSSALWTMALPAQDADQMPKKPAQVDQLELRSTVIKGNAELPKVLYIVPWQNAGAGDLDGRPMNSLLDEVLAPVDRDAFLRQVDYFGQLSVYPETDGAQN